MDEVSTRAEPAPDGGRAYSVETQLRQRNIASRLFEDDTAVKVGRFTILERLGMGAMGAVYRAYDPSLDRAVALKVLHPNVLAVAAEGEATMRREAKALARLSHPNVVAVHEVGGETSQIWIAMELVDGGSLAQRLQTLDEGTRFDWVVDAMLQAGEGLRAAHDAGIVHRDFKPANVMVGTDGRVRVADFGLASQPRDGAAASVGVGTPAYMPPEQWDTDVDARADQYAYCVVFWEALFGARPERSKPDLDAPVGADPRASALLSVLRTGLQQEPEARYPTMLELLAATRDVVFEKPRQRRQRRRSVGIVAGLVVTTSVAAWVSSGSTEVACTGASERLDGLWADDARERALGSLASNGTPYAERAVLRIREAADQFGQAWAESYEATCLAHARQESSEHVFERRMSCLDQAGAAYTAVADRVTERQPDVSALVHAAAGLPDPRACASLQPLPVASRPPEHLQAGVDEIDTLRARARTYLDAGATLRALELNDEAVAQAQALGFGPATARALHERGRISTIVGPIPELTTEQAIEDLETASKIAMREQRYPLAVEAWSRRAWLQGTQGTEPDVLLKEAELITALVRGAAPSSAQEALLYNNMGGLHMMQADRAPARELFERSAELSGQLPSRDPELENARVNLALLTDNNADRDARFERIVRDQTQRLGEEHPHVLQIQLLFAVTTAQPELARQMQTQLIATYQRFHPELAQPRLELRQELAWSMLRDGRLSETATSFAALAELSDDPRTQALARGYVRWAKGDPSAARLHFETVSATTADAPWQRSSIAEAELGLAVIEGSADRFGGAAAIFAELEHLPTAVLATRLEFASREIEGLATLKRALERWRSGVGDRAEIEATLRTLAGATARG